MVHALKKANLSREIRKELGLVSSHNTLMVKQLEYMLRRINMLNKIGGQIDCETLEVAGIYPLLLNEEFLDSRGRKNSEIDEWCNGGGIYAK